MQAAKRFLDRHGFTSDAAFHSNASGTGQRDSTHRRSRARGSVPEAGLLDTLCTLYFPDVTLPEPRRWRNRL